MVGMAQLLEQNLGTSWPIEYNIILVHFVIAFYQSLFHTNRKWHLND